MFGKRALKFLKLPPVHNCFIIAVTNKLVIINSLNVPKIKKILLKILNYLGSQLCFISNDKLVVIINSLNVPKIEEIFLYEMKFLVPNYSCLQNP